MPDMTPEQLSELRRLEASESTRGWFLSELAKHAPALLSAAEEAATYKRIANEQQERAQALQASLLESFNENSALREDRERLHFLIATGMWILQHVGGKWNVFVPGGQGDPDWVTSPPEGDYDTANEVIDAARAALEKTK